MREHSSQNRPPLDVAESLTRINLLASLRSEVCPACGAPKLRHKSLCMNCWRQLPAKQARPLYRGIDDGYDRAMLGALRFLRARRFILPDDPRAQRIEQLQLRRRLLTGEILATSAGSTICPHCAGAKAAGAALCNRCLGILPANMAPIDAKLGATAQDHRRHVRELVDRLDPLRLKIGDEAGYADTLFRAMRLLKARVFTIPKH